MQRLWLIRGMLVMLLNSIAAVSTANACGGVKAFTVDELPTTEVRKVQGPNNVTLYYDTADNALLRASAVQVDFALAEAIAGRDLARFHDGNSRHLEFEGLVYEHGDFVYKYHADVPNLTYSVRVGPVSDMSEYAHIHVSAIIGAVYGPGCGLGSGAIAMPFELTSRT